MRYWVKLNGPHEAVLLIRASLVDDRYPVAERFDKATLTWVRTSGTDHMWDSDTFMLPEGEGEGEGVLAEFMAGAQTVKVSIR